MQFRPKSFWTPRYVTNRLRLALDQKCNPDAPWWPREAARHLDGMLRHGDRCLEWGSGRSTVWLSARTSKVHSVEHDRDWFGRVQELLTSQRLDAGAVRAAVRRIPRMAAEHSPYVRIVDRFGRRRDQRLHRRRRASREVRAGRSAEARDGRDHRGRRRPLVPRSSDARPPCASGPRPGRRGLATLLRAGRRLALRVDDRRRDRYGDLGQAVIAAAAPARGALAGRSRRAVVVAVVAAGAVGHVGEHDGRGSVGKPLHARRTAPWICSRVVWSRRTHMSMLPTCRISSSGSATASSGGLSSTTTS